MSDLKQTFTITVNGETRQIKMTYGLLNTLIRLIGDVDNVVQIGLVNEVRDAALTVLLSVRGPDGTVITEINPAFIDADPAEIADLLFWSQEHLMDFFLKTAKQSVATVKDRTKDMQNLVSTATGSRASRRKK